MARREHACWRSVQGFYRQDSSDRPADAVQRLPAASGGTSFLDGQLNIEALESLCVMAGQLLTLRRHAGFDLGYFIATFAADHLCLPPRPQRG